MQIRSCRKACGVARGRPTPLTKVKHAQVHQHQTLSSERALRGGLRLLEAFIEQGWPDLQSSQLKTRSYKSSQPSTALENCIKRLTRSGKGCPGYTTAMRVPLGGNAFGICTIFMSYWLTTSTAPTAGSSTSRLASPTESGTNCEGTPDASFMKESGGFAPTYAFDGAASRTEIGLNSLNIAGLGLAGQ